MVFGQLDVGILRLQREQKNLIARILCAAVPLQKIPRPCSAPSPQPRPPSGTTGNVLPADNYLGPAMGKMTVYDNLKKLQYDLFRAEEKAKHVEAVKADMDRKHRIYVDNVMRVKGGRVHLWFIIL